MGSSFSYPESMNNIPSSLNNDEYLIMSYNDNNYIIKQRELINKIKNNMFINFFMPSNITSPIIDGNFIVYLNNNQVITTADSTDLKIFIKLFAFEKNINLEKTVFKLGQEAGRKKSYLKNIIKRKRKNIKKKIIKKKLNN
jgi:hypothetical protein